MFTFFSTVGLVEHIGKDGMQSMLTLQRSDKEIYLLTEH